MSDRLIIHANLVSMQPGEPVVARPNSAIAISDGMIAWTGSEGAVPDRFSNFLVDDIDGRLVTPGLVDCHTHLVFGGDRAREFELRLEGATYEEIARSGGGIASTVAATRGASEAELVAGALPRLDAMIAEGVTTIEIKSGYGLDIETELKMLRVARKLGQLRKVTVKTSFLGAHAVPREFAGRSDAYLDEVCLPAMEAAAAENLVDAVDGFCEGIAFSPDQISRVFARASELGLPVKLHADQLSDLGGAALASHHKALSADHLEYSSEAGVAAMAKAGTVAVILPGAFYTLREKQMPPIGWFRDHGVPMAVATDCNPGSSPMVSLLLAINMACTLFRMTPAEALAGATRNAARALGLADRGIVAPGMRADLAVWDASEPAQLSYRIGFNTLHKRYFGGNA